MSYDVQILVNGSRCKQYTHDGKTFIEAKDGSEYSIEIKNNSYSRILAVCSVDGLDILNGKPATEEGPGYVISALNSSKFDGFRVSDEKVAKFVFGAKGDSYAATKGDSSERNVGVIGIRLFQEKIKPAPITIREEHHHHHYPKPHWNTPWWGTSAPNTPPLYPTIWCDSTYSTSVSDGNLNDMGTLGGLSGTLSNSGTDALGAKNSSLIGDNGPIKMSDNTARGITGQRRITAQSMNSIKKLDAGFDMGTKWGEAKESKVVEVDFERGILALTTNIYYASRQSLLEMGVPLGNEKQVSFPEPFVDSKYAKPPKGWKA